MVADASQVARPVASTQLVGLQMGIVISVRTASMGSGVKHHVLRVAHHVLILPTADCVMASPASVYMDGKRGIQV